MKNMKRIRSMMALLLSLLTVLSLTAFAACETQNNDLANGSEQTSTLPEDSGAENPPDDEISAPGGGNNGSESSSNSTVQKPETPVEPVVQKTQYIRCTSNSVNIRSGAGTDYSVLGSAEKGTTYAVLGKTGNWYKTYYRNQVAYIYASYATVFTLEKADPDVEEVLSEGYKLLGVPYVYGAVRLHDGKGRLLSGFTAQKFDCSSLVQYVYYRGADVLLNTTTRTQVTQGKYVHPNDLQRGDCIYFTNEERQYNTGIEKIGHVAIYLGNEYILHTASDYARIEKMSAKRWSYYIEARRFL